MAARTLVEQPRRPAIVMLHHPPIVCGIPYIDKYTCREPEALSAVVAKFPTVERVLCGHVHRSFQQIWANTMVCACPSTATQIALPSPGGVLHRRIPSVKQRQKSLPMISR